MSKGRELLIGAVEWMHELKYTLVEERDRDDRDLLELIADINKIEQFLAQPELSEVHEEPPTPDGDPDVNHISPMTYREAYLRGYEKAVCALKREPLTEDEVDECMETSDSFGFNGDVYIADGFNAFENFARAIEKAHGITGVSDE